ncbi:MAG: universal stress protein [Acidobacteriota bacterium]
MKVLVAIDGSLNSTAVINEIVAREWSPDTAMCVLYVRDPKSLSSHFVDVEAYVEAENTSAKSLVKHAAEKLRARGISTTAAIMKGRPAKSIVNFAKTWGADFILLGSHETTLSHLLSKNTAKDVLRHSPCSVEIIRAKKPDKSLASQLHG